MYQNELYSCVLNISPERLILKSCQKKRKYFLNGLKKKYSKQIEIEEIAALAIVVEKKEFFFH